MKDQEVDQGEYGAQVARNYTPLRHSGLTPLTCACTLQSCAALQTWALPHDVQVDAAKCYRCGSRLRMVEAKAPST